METFILIFLIATILIRFVIGGRLFVSARQNNLPNLQWLAWYFVANAFNVLFAPHPYNPLGNQSFSVLMFVMPVLLSQAFLILFNESTFYKDKTSPAPWFWLIFAVTSFGTFYGIALTPSSTQQNPWVATYIISQVLIWVWHTSAAYRAWAGIFTEPTVADWIKSRYLLIVAYPLIFVIGSLASAVRIVLEGGASLTTLGIAMSAITLFTQFASVIMQYLVWVMPESFRAWLNRNYQSRLDEYSEQQSKAMLQMISASIAHDAGLTQFTALRALRHVIEKIIQNENSEVVEKYIGKMGYREWADLLQNPELSKQLTLISDRKDLTGTLENAMKTLVEKQSLFTIESK